MNARQDGDGAERVCIRDAAWVPEPGEMCRAATLYAARGWAVVPLREGGKAPAVARWTALRLDAQGVAKHFGGGRPNVGNLGVLTGAASGGLVDVDCDTPEAARAAAVLLPPTGLVSGRAGHPRSHYWYVVEGELPRTTKYAWESTSVPSGEGRTPCAPTECAAPSPRGRRGARWTPSASEVEDSPTHRGMLVELRADGCQTLLPPSLHPSGERVVWERNADAAQRADGAPRGAPGAERADAIRPDEHADDAVGAHGMRPSPHGMRPSPHGMRPSPHGMRPLGESMEPARVTADALRRAVGQVAAAALLARCWPGQGTRDETALALCGMLLRAGWGEEETDLFVRTVARIAGDEEWRARGTKAKGTRQRLDAGETVWGAPALAERLAGSRDEGAAVVAQARAWLGVAACESLAIERQALIDSHQRSEAVNEEVGSQWGLLLSEVDDARVEWLWQDRIPLGMLTLLDGDPGLGKSLITADLIARVTSGRDMPDDSPGQPCSVGAVLLSSEDSQRATIRPRLRAAGAELGRVLVEQTVRAWDEAKDRVVERAFMLPTDLPVLRRAIERVGAKLVVIDPLMAYLEGRVNSWRDQDIRAALAPLARLADETGAAILILRHLNKSSGTNAIYRGGGSIGIIGAARSGLLVAKSPDDPEHERVLTGTKSNLAAPLSSLAYRIATTEEGLPRIDWLGASEHTATTLLSAPADAEPSSLEQAVAYVQEALAGGPMPSDTLQRQVLAVGISYRTYLRARKQLGVATRHQGFGGRQWSHLPSSADDAAAPAVTPPTAGTPLTATAAIDCHPSPKGANDGAGTQCDGAANHLPPAEAPAPDAGYAASVYLLEQRAQGQAGRGSVELELGVEDGGEMCALDGAASAANSRSTAGTVPEDLCHKTGGAHQYALQRDVHYHPVCIECGQADLTRTVRDPADERRFAQKEHAGSTG